jgi:ABC-type nickel/cobalt efflux system permease component RcnA
VTAAPLAGANAPAGRIVLRLALALAALALVGAVVALRVWLLAPAAPPPPVRNPFGTGLREAAPAATGLGGTILALQSAFYKSIQTAVAALKQDAAAIWSVMGLGFAYGAFHAAGPGHGKAVIAAYLVSNERALVKGIALSFAAALVQALVAVALVGAVAVAFRATAATMTEVARYVELASFAAVAALGAVLLWRKAGKALGVAALARDPRPVAPEAQACDHVHLPPPEALEHITRWRELAGLVLAAGIRPCSGALIVLVFGLSQGLFAAGVAATLAMALGTALTTGAIAALAVFAKALALRFAGGRGPAGVVAVSALELLAAAFVLVLGLALLAGVWNGTAGS